jgi:hypothetical protein
VDCNPYICIYEKILQRLFKGLPSMCCCRGVLVVRLEDGRERHWRPATAEAGLRPMEGRHQGPAGSTHRRGAGGSDMGGQGQRRLVGHILQG